jgi:hypothetical protein
MHDAVAPAPGRGLPTEFASPERASPEEVRQAAKTLTSEGLLCRLLDAMPDCVLVLNKHRQIIFGNAALVRMAAGMGCQAFLGQRPGELLSCRVASEAPSGCGTGEACRNCGAALTILDSLGGKKATNECRILTGPGDGPCALDLQVSGTPFDWLGERYVLLVVGDISSTKRRQVLERIFFHDILNTAGSIQGIAGLLSSGDATLPEMVGDLTTATDSLVNEIKSHRILMAAENNELAARPVPLQSLDILGTVTRAFRGHPVAENRVVEIAPGSVDFAFRSDPALLMRVLGNLLKNALEATKAGQSVVHGCRREGMEAVFWCQNAACMPRSVQLQLFQRSFSTKGSGRGIGTYSIKLLTERYLKGRVSFVSTEETGTVFTVRLPVD